MRFRNSLLCLLTSVLFLQNPSADAAKILGFGSKGYDVVLVGTPISVREITGSESLDAVETSDTQNAPSHVVSFKIERVLIGELPKRKRGGPSRLDQAGDAIHKKEFLKALSMNFKDPQEELNPELFRVAVKDIGETFGITPGEPLPAHQFKLYLKRLPKQKNTFLFVKRELLD